MNPTDVIAVLGTCAPERARVARDLAAETGRALVPAARLASRTQPPLTVAEAARWCVGRGAVVELPETYTGPAVVEEIGDEEDLALSHVICVVDAGHLLDDLARDDDVRPAADDASTPTPRALITATQLEHATEVILTRWRHLSTPELSLMLAVASHLNPSARLQLHRSPLPAIVADSPFALATPGWVDVLNDEFTPHMTDPRLQTLHYENVRPFHPGRLRRLLEDGIGAGAFGRIIRSVGFCRLATRSRTVAQWNHAGTTIAFAPISEEAEDDPLALGQDLALMGIDMHPARLRQALDEATVTDAEFLAGTDAWRRFPDPFPAWSGAPRVTE